VPTWRPPRGCGRAWRAFPRQAAQQQALGALLQALPATPFAAQAARQVSEVLHLYEAGGWRAARVAGRRPGGVTGLCFDYLSAGGPCSAERIRKLIPLVTTAVTVTSNAA
jgi:hypothetical protein